MASKLIVLSIAVTLLMGTGCSKNRGWLSRKDYSEMSDPFMEPSEAIAKSGDKSSDGVGRATLGSADSSPTDRSERSMLPGMAGPKPIRTAAATNEAVANGRSVSPAKYPTDPDLGGAGDEPAAVKSYSGPALSDFLQKRQSAAQDAANEVKQLPAKTQSTVRSNVNPAATRAATPAAPATISPEVENFSQFLTNKSNAVAEKTQQATQQANQKVQDTSAGVNDFAAWAEQQKAEWSTSAGAVQSTVAETPAKTKQAARSVFQQAKTASQEMANSMMTPEFDDSGDETATPLLKQKNTPPPATGSVLSKAKAPTANDFAADSNPFEESFDEFHSSGSAAAPQKPATSSSGSGNSRPSLDDSFRMDTGWKPSNLTRP